MSNMIQNLLVLGFCWLVATGGGVWLTFVQQPAEMDRLEKAEKVARMKQTELTSLMSDMSASEEIANEVVTRWNARYKVVPRTLGSEEVISFLNQHTQTGFTPFDIMFKGMTNGAEYNTYTFDVTGRGHFKNLYSLIWSIENSRQLYRIDNLKLSHIDIRTVDPRTQRPVMDVMVSFDFTLTSYFGGVAGLSATDEAEQGDALPVLAQSIDPTEDLPQVPLSVLPAREPAGNPFYPHILELIPPNTHNLVDVESAEMVFIANGEAVFKWNDSFVSVGAGESVYLGQIISVDPMNERVTARLNKGGIIDEVVLVLDTGERFRQAIGSSQIAPTQKN